MRCEGRGKWNLHNAIPLSMGGYQMINHIFLFVMKVKMYINETL